MKNKSVVLVVVVILSAGLIWFVISQKKSQISGAGQVEGCPGETIEVMMPDGHMAGTVEAGQTVMVVTKWYKCNPVERGDVVLFRYSQVNDPIIRVVRAIPGDEFKLKKATNNNSWNIEINGDLLMEKDQPFHFGSANAPVLSLYEKASKGKLDERTVLLFANVSPGENDSGSLGAVSIADLIGKVLLNGAQAPTAAKPATREAQTLEPVEASATTEGASAEAQPKMISDKVESKKPTYKKTNKEEKSNE